MTITVLVVVLAVSAAAQAPSDPIHPIDARSDLLDLIDRASDVELVELYGVQCATGVQALDARSRMWELLDAADDERLLELHRRSKSWEAEVHAETSRNIAARRRYHLQRLRKKLEETEARGPTASEPLSSSRERGPAKAPAIKSPTPSPPD